MGPYTYGDIPLQISLSVDLGVVGRDNAITFFLKEFRKIFEIPSGKKFNTDTSTVLVSGHP
jgi:hypothetical protein